MNIIAKRLNKLLRKAGFAILNKNRGRRYRRASDDYLEEYEKLSPEERREVDRLAYDDSAREERFEEHKKDIEYDLDDSVREMTKELKKDLGDYASVQYEFSIHGDDTDYVSLDIIGKVTFEWLANSLGIKNIDASAGDVVAFDVEMDGVRQDGTVVDTGISFAYFTMDDIEQSINVDGVSRSDLAEEINFCNKYQDSLDYIVSNEDVIADKIMNYYISQCQSIFAELQQQYNEAVERFNEHDFEVYQKIAGPEEDIDPYFNYWDDSDAVNKYNPVDEDDYYANLR